MFLALLLERLQALRPGFTEPERSNSAISADRLLPFLRAGYLLHCCSGDSPSARVAFAWEAHRLEQGLLRFFTPFSPLRRRPPEVCRQALLHLWFPELGQRILRERRGLDQPVAEEPVKVAGQMDGDSDVVGAWDDFRLGHI